MTALLFLIIIVGGALVVALALNIAADHREAERGRRHLENLKRLGGRDDSGGWS